MRKIHIDNLFKQTRSYLSSGTIYTEISPKLMTALGERGWGNNHQHPDHKFVFFYHKQDKKILSFDKDDGFIEHSGCSYEKIEVIGLDTPPEPISKPRPFNRWDYIDLD